LTPAGREGVGDSIGAAEEALIPPRGFTSVKTTIYEKRA